MKKKGILVIILLFLKTISIAQISTKPIFPNTEDKLTIIFDSSKESRLGYYTGDLYAHTGVNNWQNVIGEWGDNNKQPKLKYTGNGIYELEITPNIYSYYSVLESEKITKLAFVFRTADNSKQTNDLFIEIYKKGLVINITEPDNNKIIKKNTPLTISAITNTEADIKIYIDKTKIAESRGDNISTENNFSQTGYYWIIAEASANDKIVKDSVSIFVRNNTITEAKPIIYKKGINYPTNNSAALVLWAPYKEFIFVIGDFNDWKLDNNFQMKKDGDFFWIDIPNLVKEKEYIFQYLIDGEIKIADPYTEKTVNPWHDKYITEQIYPNLIEYPENKTEGIASVLQTGEKKYLWDVENYQIKDKNNLIIYELLIRDFTKEHTFKAVREKLDYLEDLNINVLELMPVNEFEGNSSWGYNPSFYFAPDKYYGPKDELKKLIDECHKRDIAVVIDMVLNHSYGQSPFVQMYMNNWTITPENPWYNISSPNQTYNWGYDFNHEADEVKELVDSINSFWLNEYKIDGFRFDFTKGFTQNPGDGWEYDASRIAILKRMANEIWERKPNALVILEHLAENSEEKELAEHGMLLWGNMNGQYRNAAKGNISNSDLSGAIYSNRGWSNPSLVSYAESHDEERVMFECLNYGYNNNNNYNIKYLPTALDRIELNSVFHITLPGPKMIWQFGERGYDISINDFGGRTNEKPPYWNYLEDSNRTDLFKIVSSLNYLKETYEEFSTKKFSYNLTGKIKNYKLSSNDNHVIVIGNFDVQTQTADITFFKTGKWYRYFKNDSIELTTTEQMITLAPGEYRLYSTRRFNHPHIVTNINEPIFSTNSIKIFPNPADKHILIQGLTPGDMITLYNISGQNLLQKKVKREDTQLLQINNFSKGLYIINITTSDSQFSKKIIIK